MNRAEFANLVRDCHAEVYRAALAMVGREDQAADVVQEVYLDVLAGRIDLTGADAPCGLLRWYAIRRSLMAHRAANSRRKKEQAVSSSRHEPQEAIDSILGAERDQILWRELLDLPDDLRRPLLLRYREELGLARIGEVLGLPVQTVHDRIARALERLKPRLRTAGFTALITPEILRASPGPILPSGLEATLLGFGKKAALALGAKLLTGLILVAAVGLGVGRFVSDDEPERPLDGTEIASAGETDGRASRPTRHRGSERALAPAAAVDATPQEPPIKKGPPLPAPTFPPAPVSTLNREVLAPDTTPGRIRGRVLDQNDRPVGAALVTASSVEHLGKMPRYAASVRSGPDGRFEVEVPVGKIDVRDYRLFIRLEEHEPLTTRPFEVRVRDLTETGDHRLRHLGIPASVKVELSLVDRDGRGLAGVLVELMPLQDRPGEEPWPNPGLRDLSDATGRLSLEPKLDGPHRLRIDGRRSGFGNVLFDLDLPARGLVERRVVLEPGRSLALRVVDTEGRVPAGLSLRLRDPRDPNEWLDAVRAGDVFIAKNLSAGPYEIWNDDGLWSSFRLTGVMPVEQGIDIVVKRLEDLRDLGLHRGEVHLRARDASNGRFVEFGVFEVEVHKVEDLPEAEVRRDRAPWLMAAPIVQRCATSLEETILPPIPGSEGMCHLDGLEPGLHLVAIRKEGFAARLLGPFRITGNEIIVLDPVDLEAPRRIEGRLVDPAGKPVSGAIVLAGGEGAASRSEAERIKALVAERSRDEGILLAGAVTTDADGRFTLTELATDLPFVIRAFDRKGAMAESALIGEGPTEPLCMIMQP